MSAWRSLLDSGRPPNDDSDATQSAVVRKNIKSSRSINGMSLSNRVVFWRDEGTHDATVHRLAPSVTVHLGSHIAYLRSRETESWSGMRLPITLFDRVSDRRIQGRTRLDTRHRKTGSNSDSTSRCLGRLSSGS
jgi:hypothetical protein